MLHLMKWNLTVGASRIQEDDLHACIRLCVFDVAVADSSHLLDIREGVLKFLKRFSAVELFVRSVRG